MTPPAASRHDWLDPSILAATVLWLGLLAAALAGPYLTRSPSLGDDLIRNTIRLALLYYAAAAALMLRLRPGEWTGRRGRAARWLWTLAWAAFLVHLAMAFHHAHHWSHADAVRHTEDVSGVGEGIYVSYLFTLAWTADVLCWWLRPARYAARPGWVDGWLHGFMAFVIFNSTVVFEQGFIRWAGVVLCAGLAALWLRRRWEKRAACGGRCEEV
jgi:hypothetical protein